jgi:hypothetical protein
MRKVSPSVRAREDLNELLRGGIDEGENLISALVDTVTRLVVQELLEAEQTDYLGGRGHYERRVGRPGSRNGYVPGYLRTAEGAIGVRVPQVRGTESTYRSSLMSFLERNSEVLDRLVTEMYARGLSTRDVEDAFRDATGELLISKSAVSEITDQLWEDYQAPSSPATSPRSRSSTCSATPSSSRSGARGQGSPARRLVHRRRRAKAPVAPGRRQQGVRGSLDRVLPEHSGPGPAPPDHGRHRRGTGDDQGGRGGFLRVDPDPLLVPLPLQHPIETPRRRSPR